MLKSFERKIALRYVKPSKKQGFLSLISILSFLGITIGVGTLIIVMAVINGTKDELKSSIIGVDSHITINPKFENFITDYEGASVKAEENDNVELAMPLINGTVLANANGGYNVVQVQGARASDFERNSKISDKITQGRLWKADNESSIVIGDILARKLRLNLGGTLRLVSPQTTSTFFGGVPVIKDFEIVGIFKTGINQIDKSIVFIPFDFAKIYFEASGASSVKVYLKDSNSLDADKADIEGKFDIAYHVSSWKDDYKDWFETIETQGNVFFIILSLIVLIAAFNIISSMVMLVNAKQKEISILRTIGARQGSVLRIFIFTGAIIGVLGTIFGFAWGYLFATNIDSIRMWLESITRQNLLAAEFYFLSSLPAKVDNYDVVRVVIMSLGLSFLAPIYPALKASRQNIVDGLKYE